MQIVYNVKENITSSNNCCCCRSCCCSCSSSGSRIIIVITLILSILSSSEISQKSLINQTKNIKQDPLGDASQQRRTKINGWLRWRLNDRLTRLRTPLESDHQSLHGGWSSDMKSPPSYAFTLTLWIEWNVPLGR